MKDSASGRLSLDHSGPLLCDPALKEHLEARNGADQLAYITELVQSGAKVVRESHVRQLQQLAVQDIYPCAGNYRDARFRVVIENSPHELPEAAMVRIHILDALDWLESNQTMKPALERASYALWRFNWIHPFAGGNGRTSRAIAYLIVCMDAGKMFPGTPTLPRRIYEARKEYILALQTADDAAKAGHVDVRAMTAFLRHLLLQQLAAAVDSLTRPSQP